MKFAILVQVSCSMIKSFPNGRNVTELLHLIYIMISKIVHIIAIDDRQAAPPFGAAIPSSKIAVVCTFSISSGDYQTYLEIDIFQHLLQLVGKTVASLNWAFVIPVQFTQFALGTFEKT
jgi:hypothetical protein